MTKNHKLWGGRFESSLEKWVEEFGASISFDQKLAPYDSPCHNVRQNGYY